MAADPRGSAACTRCKGRGVLPDTILGESPCTACRGSGSATVAALPDTEVRPDTAATTVRTRYTVRVCGPDGVVIFDGSVTDKDFFRMEQKEGRSTTVCLSATAAIEGMTHA